MSHPRLRSLLFAAPAALALGAALLTSPPADATTAPAAAEVSPHAAQTIDDIGASGAWWVNDLRHFDPKVQARVARLLFSPQGLHLSSYRYNIGGGDTAVTTPARAAEDFLKPDGSYDWSRDEGGRTFLGYAARYGVKDLIGVSATLAARSVTTYVFDRRGHGSTAVTGALVGKQSGKCLTAGASGAAITSCTGAADQSWSYDAHGTLKGANGYLTAGGSGLTATPSARRDGTQRWLLNGNGQIVNEASGRCLDVSGQATADGSEVILHSCNGGADETWSRR